MSVQAISTHREWGHDYVVMAQVYDFIKGNQLERVSCRVLFDYHDLSGIRKAHPQFPDITFENNMWHFRKVVGDSLYTASMVALV